MSDNIQRARAALKRIQDNNERATYEDGLLGRINPSGPPTFVPRGRAGYKYVRIGTLPPVVARDNIGVPESLNLPVRVKKEIIVPNSGIIHYSIVASLRDESMATTPPPPPGGIPAHTHDDRYYTETEHIDVSAGAADAGKPIVLAATGQVDPSMIDLSTVDIGAVVHAATVETTPLDADETLILDSASSFALRRITWTTIKAFLKTYFDTLYELAGAIATHAALTVTHGATGAITGTTNTQTLTNKTLTAPVIADFTNAAHDHGDADDGGNIPYSSITGTPGIPVSVGTFLEYTTTTTVTLPPPSGKWATNNINFASTVELGVSYFDADSNDISEKWATFSGIINDTIGMMWIQQEDDATVWAAFRLTGIQFFPADDYALFNAEFIGGSGTSMPNNTPCRIIFSVSGDAGWSAYEVAVDQGFVGDEAAWLASLVGPQGDPGDAADIAAEISGASTDDTIDDADLFPRTTGGALVKTAWSNIKAALIAAFVATGTYSPVVTGSTGNPTITYTENVGKYTTLFGVICFFSLRVIINAYSGGSGDFRVSLPFTAANTSNADATRNSLTLSNVDITVVGYNAVLRVQNGSAYATCVIAVDNAAVNTAQIADFATGDGINATGFYWI